MPTRWTSISTLKSREPLPDQGALAPVAVILGTLARRSGVARFKPPNPRRQGHERGPPVMSVATPVLAGMLFLHVGEKVWEAAS